jgi:hypothetical protein
VDFPVKVFKIRTRGRSRLRLGRPHPSSPRSRSASVTNGHEHEIPECARHAGNEPPDGAMLHKILGMPQPSSHSPRASLIAAVRADGRHLRNKLALALTGWRDVSQSGRCALALRRRFFLGGLPLTSARWDRPHGLEL